MNPRLLSKLTLLAWSAGTIVASWIPCSAATFRRGDSNADGGVNISDPIALLGNLFLGSPEIACQDAADENDDGSLDISDAIHTLSALFLGSEAALEPPRECGRDPTEDGLNCVEFAPCAGIEWIARHNGPGNGWDHARAIAVDGEGNAHVTGEAYVGGADSSLSVDYLTIKYAGDGRVLWEARYSGGERLKNRPFGLTVDAAGNVYVTGESIDDEYRRMDIATVKYGPGGDQAWAARYRGPGWSGGLEIAVDAEGSVFVSGGAGGGDRPASDFVVIKYDRDGHESWVANYDGQGMDSANALTLDPAGNVTVAGFVTNFDTPHQWDTLKLDPAGNRQWVDRFTEALEGQGGPYDMTSDSNGNIYVAGGFAPWGGDWDFAVVKYAPGGEREWVASYDGADAADYAFRIVLDPEENAVVTGTSASTAAGEGDYATVKFDGAGRELWSVRYDGPAGGADMPQALGMDAAGNVYVTGQSMGIATGLDFATLVYDSAGREVWSARFDGAASGADTARALAVDAAGNIYVTGESEGVGTEMDFVTIKYAPTLAR